MWALPRKSHPELVRGTHHWTVGEKERNMAGMWYGNRGFNIQSTTMFHEIIAIIFNDIIWSTGGFADILILLKSVATICLNYQEPVDAQHRSVLGVVVTSYCPVSSVS